MLLVPVFRFLLLLLLLLPMVIFTDKLATRYLTTSGFHTVKCYSCMSKFYESVWPHLSGVYRIPSNFTDLCNNGNHIGKTLVPTVDCSSICVKMTEQSSVAGMRIRGHIRGCFDTILRHQFNQTIVQWYRWMHRDSCRQYKKRELLQLSPYQVDDSYVSVCTCYADYCNGANNGVPTGFAADSWTGVFLAFHLYWLVRITT